ncbi:MAG TPA: hypothetical protein VFE32_05170 [Puia sp.]|jgi:hypothetical protein|nr:hypothetical protein [Puia sp.]
MKFPTICLLLFALAVSCKKTSNASLAGSYKVSGTITTRSYPCWPCLDSVAPTYNTVPFDTLIKVVHVNSDTFRLYGLDYHNMDTQDGPCTYSYLCGFFAIGMADSLSWIPINDDPGGTIGGGALIKGDSAYFTYYQNFRNVLTTYSLSGRRE